MDIGTSKCGKYRIEYLTPDTIKGALDVIRHAFCMDESVCVASEVYKNPAAIDELVELCADTALDSVSLIAVEISTRKVVAIAFNKLQVNPEIYKEKPFFEIFADERCKEEAAKSVVRFMSFVDTQIKLFQQYNADCSFEIMFLATLQDHRGRGLAALLCSKSVDLAKVLKNSAPIVPIKVKDLGPEYSHMKDRDVSKLRPKFCQAIWTSHISQKVGKDLGFKVELTISYDLFSYNGKTFSERIDHTKYCELATKLY